MLLYCCETQLIRTKFWEQIARRLSFYMEFVERINCLDDHSFLYTMQSLYFETLHGEISCVVSNFVEIFNKII